MSIHSVIGSSIWWDISSLGWPKRFGMRFVGTRLFPQFSRKKTNGSQNLTRMYDLTYLQVSQQYCNPEAPHAASYEFLVSYTKGSTGSALPCSQEPQKLPRRCQVERGNINIAIVLHLIGVSLHIANKDQSWPNNLPQLPQRASGGSKGCHPFDTLCERSRS